MDHPVSDASRAQGRFACAKAHRRLYIQDTTTGTLLYTCPDFIQHRDRRLMTALAQCANARGALDIRDIVLLESLSPRAKGYTPRSSHPTTGHDPLSTQMFFPSS